MPNSAATVDVVFGHKVNFAFQDELGNAQTVAYLTVSDGDRTYYAEEGGSFVLPDGMYSCLFMHNDIFITVPFVDVTENGTITCTIQSTGLISTVVLFDIVPAVVTNENIVVKDSFGTVMTVTSGRRYLLFGGTYTYTVSADGYVTKSGSFTVGDDAIITVSLCKMGDVDGDVDLFDFMAVMYIALGISDITGDALLAADIDNDGDVDLFDFMAVMNLALGI